MAVDFLTIFLDSLKVSSLAVTFHRFPPLSQQFDALSPLLLTTDDKEEKKIEGG